jgi:hypothetical protein
MLRKVDREETKFKISMLIARCCAMLNIEKNMNNEQIKFAAEHLVEHKWMYSFEDIQLCLDRGAAGMYGAIYNRLDLSIINEWLAKFEQERNAHITAIRQEETIKQNIYEIFNHPAMKAALEKTVEEMPKVEIKADTTERKLTPFEKLVLDEYDALPTWADDARFKLYNNRPYLFSEYRKERYDEEIKNQNEY